MDGLERFCTKRREWLKWLEDDPVHALNTQIHDMMWCDVTYRTLNEARRFAWRKRPASSIAPLLGELIDNGYVAAQILAVCKLVDVRKDVISLWRLVQDIKAHRDLITRESYVTFDNVPYDYEAAKQQWYRIRADGEMWVPREVWTSQVFHECFDKLSGTTVSNRSPADRVKCPSGDFVSQRNRLADFGLRGWDRL